MAEQQAQRNAQATQDAPPAKPPAKAASEFDKLMLGSCSYKPFAEDDEIKLSPGIIYKYLCHPTKSGVWPDEQQIMKFQILCRSRKLNPFEGDAYLVGYDGKYGPEFSIITAIQAIYKRAEANPNYDGIESGVIVEDGKGMIVQRQGDFCHEGDKLLGGWANVYRKDKKYPDVERLNLENRDKNRSVWNSDKAGMIVKCAEAGALRKAFPSQIGGLFTREEIVAALNPVDGRAERERAEIDVDKILGPAREETSKPGGSSKEAPRPRPTPVPPPPGNRTMTGEPWNSNHQRAAQPVDTEPAPDEAPDEIPFGKPEAPAKNEAPDDPPAPPVDDFGDGHDFNTSPPPAPGNEEAPPRPPRRQR